MSSEYLTRLADHIWQSSLFVGAVGLLMLTMQNNRARTRHWMWLAASCKFLVPFSLLIFLGNSIRWRTAPETTSARFSIAMSEASQPFTGPVSSTFLTAAGSSGTTIFPTILFTFWACGFAGFTCSWWIRWSRIRTAVRTGSHIPMEIPMRAVYTPAMLEPGVFGIRRPVLILPEDILHRLTPAQLEAIFAHELCHVRHWDNLTASVQMFVETLFWFYPLVWWIGKRIVEERERACDEEVLRLGSEPRVYAEGILQICKFYLESPLVSMSGATGANLKRRIERIMSNRTTARLNAGRKILLAMAAAVAVGGPIVVGMTSLSPILRAQSQVAFEVASVKRHPLGSQMLGFPQFMPGGRVTTAGGVPVQILISVAYGLPFQSTQLSGGPDWIRSPEYLYDIDAKADPQSLIGLSSRERAAKVRSMLQTLLADRFKLVLLRSVKEQPVYVLTVGKNGPKLQSSRFEEKDCENAANPCHAGGAGQGRGIHVKGFTMAELVVSVSNFTDRPLIDHTGLAGLYDIDTEGWLPMRQRPVPANDSTPESIAMADPSRRTLYQIFEALGLKMESSKAPVEMFVIEHVEKPTEN